MNDRIKKIRNTLGMNQTEFASEIGLKQNAISNMEKPGATVTDQNIRFICTRFLINEEWLRTGNGEMFEKSTSRKQMEFFEIFNDLKPELQEYLLKTAKTLLETQKEMEEK